MSYPLVALGDCCRVISGATPKREVAKYWGGDISWVTPKDLSKHNSIYLYKTPEKITRAGLKSCSAEILPIGSLLFSSRAPIGHIAIVGTPMCTNQGFKSLIPSAQVDSIYLYYCLLWMKSKIEAMGNGATFKEVSKKIVERVQIPLPPLGIQKQIASILEKSDALRKRCHRLEQEFNILTRSLFLKMFGDPFTNPKKFRESFIGDISLRVTDGEHQTPKRTSNGIKLLSARNIQHGYIDVINEKVDYIGTAEHERISKRLIIDKTDILISCSGTIGRTSINTLDEKFCLVRSVAVIKPDQQKINPIFLMAYLNSDHMQAVMHKEANSSGQPNLFQNQIRKLKIIVPEMQHQLKFEQIYDNIQKQKKSMQIQSVDFQLLFDSLLQKIFNGKINLKSIGETSKTKARAGHV